MENCLVTKLKSVVNNDNLVGIGEYKMHINLSSAEPYVKFAGNSGTITILGNNNYYFTQNGQQTKTINYSNVVATWPAGEYDVLFTNKYAITLCDRAKGIDLEVFAFSNGLNYISAFNAHGDITFLNGKNLNLGISLTGDTNKNITGPLSVVASAVSANQSIKLNNTSIVGDIALLGHTGSALFTSGSKRLFIAGSGVTINGKVNSVNDDIISLIVEDATHWYYPSMANDKIDNPIYNVTSYAKNPTEEQIAAWQANNNTVVVLS